MSLKRGRKPNRAIPPPNGDPDQLLTAEEAANILRVKTGTLDNWRSTGMGPRFIKSGGIRYRRSDLREYIESRARRSTIEKKPA